MRNERNVKKVINEYAFNKATFPYPSTEGPVNSYKSNGKVS